MGIINSECQTITVSVWKDNELRTFNASDVEAFGSENLIRRRKDGDIKSVYKVGWVKVNGSAYRINYEHIRELKEYFKGKYRTAKNAIVEHKRMRYGSVERKATDWTYTIEKGEQ